MKIIDQVASDQNLLSALHHCRRGKKTSQGYQKFILGMPETLLNMQHDLLRGTYQWPVPDIVFVLKNGDREPDKDEFKSNFRSWNYAINGKTIDERTLRIAVAFDKDNLLIVTVIPIGKRRSK